ncbi:MAG: DMT family transporter [Anaerolineales bacterium]|nr:DMT family transporter [Anaerolineales bacterium]
MSSNKSALGWGMALIATFALSTTAPVGRAAIKAGMNPTALLAARYCLAWALLSLTLSVTRRSPGLASEPAASRSSSLRIDRRGIVLCSLAGLASGAATNLYFWSLSRINASISAMLISIYPLAVLLLLALRGERFSLLSGARLALGIAGVYMLLGAGGQVEDAQGALLALLSAASFAIQLVIVQWYLGPYPVKVVANYIVAVTALVVLGLWLASGAPWYVPGWQGWLEIGVLAVISTYISRLAMFRAIQEIGSGQVALLSPLETLLAVIWSLVFLQESLSLIQGLGGGLILSSALLAASQSRRPASKGSMPELHGGP